MLVLVDLDGVFADFVSGACAVHRREIHDVTSLTWHEEWGMTASDFWKPIELRGAGFYPDYVPPYPWWLGLRVVLAGYRHVVVSANPTHPGLLAGKMEWINDHLGQTPVVLTASSTATHTPANGKKHTTALKELLAGPDRVLIDDCDDNIDAFRAAGGHAITFPQPWNVMHAMVRHRVSFVKDCLESLEAGLKHAINKR